MCTKAELCPVCEGERVLVNHILVGHHYGIPVYRTVEVECHGCDGDGWVEVASCCEYCPNRVPSYIYIWADFPYG